MLKGTVRGVIFIVVLSTLLFIIELQNLRGDVANSMMMNSSPSSSSGVEAIIGNVSDLVRESTRSMLDWRWAQWVKNYAKNLDDAQYCMLWCQANDEIFFNESAGSIYRDSPPLTRQTYRVDYQSGGENATGLKCCQIATRESFSVILDSTKPIEEMTDSEEITMVTFGTFNRFEALREQRRRWKGPIVFVLYSIDYNDQLLHTDYRKEAQEILKVATEEQWQDMLIVQYVALHAKDKNALRHLQNYLVTDDGQVVPDFPINSLRNVAMDYARTRFVMADDIDLITGEDTYDALRTHVGKLRSEDLVGLSIPLFQKRACYSSTCKSEKEHDEYPKVWSELEKKFRAGAIRPWSCDISRWNASDLQLDRSAFHGNCSFKMDEMHPVLCDAMRLHHYPEYFNLSRSGSSDLIFQIEASTTDEQMLMYEPYVVQSRVTVSGPLIRYNELFISRGYDKVSFISSLRKLNYKFYTVPGTFLMHKDHPITVWKSKDSYDRLKNRTLTMIRTFLSDIEMGRK